MEVRASYHPFDQEQGLDPFDALAEARQHCPVMRCQAPELPDAVLVSRYTDVCAAFRDHRTFGNMSSKLTVEAHDAALATLPGVGDLDPPEHGQVRRLLNLAVAPRAIEQADQHIGAVARSIVERMVSAGHADLVREWAAPIPSDALAFVLGLPESDWPTIHGWVEAQFSDANIDTRTNARGLGAPPPAFVDYVRLQVEARRSSPGSHSDALSKMVAFERADGTAFSDAEIVHHVRTLLTAGNETTTSLMCNVVRRLLTIPGAQARVRADLALVPVAIEESLRLDPPVGVFNRRVRQPSALGGTELEVDEVLAVSIASANRDEAAFGDDAATFRLERFLDPSAVPGHVGFGLGAHFCVGAALARMSARVGITALLTGTSHLELEPGWTYQNVPHHALNRPRTLPVRLTAPR